MATRSIPFEPHFGAFILETLTLGMYGESRNALREYVQNGFDSLTQAVDDGLISPDDAVLTITLDAERDGLTIKDLGGGLRTENAVSILASVGASNKDYRRNAGFRGIGRLAGIVFCDKMIFSTKAAGQTQRTVVTFDARQLRERLAPHGSYETDAAATLRSCVDARIEDAEDVGSHYFEVRLEGFSDPPLECVNVDELKTFVGQVSPLAYAPQFVQGEEIATKARDAGFGIECIRVLVRDGEGAPEEIFKPYGAEVGVKRARTPIIVDYLRSPTGAWWAWVGRKRVPGTVKDVARGIRVRVRNIQIDDTKIVRDIFAVSHLGGKPRSTYARFADWYVGEVFVKPDAAIPNARRDGFEEDRAWQTIRDEIDVAIADKYGKLAYRISSADQLSVESLEKRFSTFQEGADPLIADGAADWDAVSQVVFEANELQTRLAKAVRIADAEELRTIRTMAERVSYLKHDLNRLVIAPAADSDCRAEVEDAVSKLTQKLYRALRDRLGPSEWQRVREIVREVSGEEPV